MSEQHVNCDTCFWHGLTKEALAESEARCARLEAFARWLVAMDDPEDARGMANRRTARLVDITERARQCLSMIPTPEEEPYTCIFCGALMEECGADTGFGAFYRCPSPECESHERGKEQP